MQGFSCYIFRWYPGPDVVKVCWQVGMNLFVFFIGLSWIILIFPGLNLSLLSNFLLGLCWKTVDLYVSLPSDFLTYWSCWVIPCYRDNLLQFIRLCTFWQAHHFCQWIHTTLPVVMCHSEWHVECHHSAADLFHFFHLFLSAWCHLWKLSYRESSSLAVSSSWCGYCWVSLTL